MKPRRARGIGGHGKRYSVPGRLAQGFFRGLLPRWRRLGSAGRGAADDTLDTFADDAAVPDVTDVIDDHRGALGAFFGNGSIGRSEGGAGASPDVAHLAAERGGFGGGVAVAARGARALPVPAAVGSVRRFGKIIVLAVPGDTPLPSHPTTASAPRRRLQKKARGLFAPKNGRRHVPYCKAVSADGDKRFNKFLQPPDAQR